MDPLNLPARREPSHLAVDPYEAAYMKPTGGATRQRTAVPGRVFAAAAVLTAIVAGVAASWKLAVVGVVCVAWMLFAVLRVQLEDDALVVHFGWIRRSIPLSSIVSVAVTRYSMTEGVGVLWLRKTARGLLFAVPGSGGGAVAVTFRDEHGRMRTWILASAAPDALCEAISRSLDTPPRPTPGQAVLGEARVQQRIGAAGADDRPRDRVDEDGHVG